MSSLPKQLLIVLILIKYGVLFATNLQAEDRCPIFEYKCLNSNCIPESFRCDGKDDCFDNSDELFCDKNIYHCYNGKSIHLSQLCDGKKDCSEDEDPEICKSNKCINNEFMCPTSPMNCISFNEVCDNKYDCQDKSDESPGACEMVRDAKIVYCNSETQFRCADKTMCISKNYKCDGTQDCLDGSDENTNCTKPKPKTEDKPSTPVPKPKSPCRSDEFYCGPNSPSGCITNEWRCDLSIDCENDGLDEKGCSNFKCPLYRPYKCHNEDICYDNITRCDGFNNCPDGSDELDCDSKYARPSKNNSTNSFRGPVLCNDVTQFKCVKRNICIDRNKICDGVNDCKDNADERPGGNVAHCQNNPCLLNNGGCQQNCANYFYTRKCYCDPGFRVSKFDPTKCDDINECEEYEEFCSQTCRNFPGSYKCECSDGFYKTHSNSTECLAVGEKFLLYSTSNSIREYRLLHHEMEQLLSVKTNDISSLLTVGVDYDYRNQRIFWTQFHPHPEIGELKHKSNKYTYRSLYRWPAGINSPVGLAYDWIHGLLFWTDIHLNQISVLNVTSGWHKVLFNLSTKSRLRSIVVHPQLRRLYFTNWGSTAKIESIGLDGLDHKTIVSDHLKAPNGLAIDFYKDDLYWVDGKSRSINAINFKTNKIRNIKSQMESFGFSLDVFEDWLYLTDWKLQRILKIHKITGVSSELIKSPKPMGIKLMHELAQPISFENVCFNHPCQHFCLPIALDPMNHKKFRCGCPETSRLLSDGVNCSEPTDLKLAQYIYPLNCHNKSTDSEDCHNPINRPYHFAATRQGSTHKSTVVVAVAVIFVMFVLISVLILVFIVYRNYMRRVIKQSTNFHNPTYFHRSPTSEIQMLNTDPYMVPPPTCIGGEQEILQFSMDNRESDYEGLNMIR